MGGGAGFGVGAGLEQELGRVGTGQEQGRSWSREGTEQKQGMEQELRRSWAEAWQKHGRSKNDLFIVTATRLA